MGFVFTKPIEGKYFKAAPGMPVPPKYAKASTLRYFRQTFGEDCIAEVDYRNPEKFVALFSGNPDLGEKLRRMQTFADEQASVIKNQKAEIKRLEKLVSTLEPK